jgi:hypothetical protein
MQKYFQRLGAALNRGAIPLGLLAQQLNYDLSPEPYDEALIYDTVEQWKDTTLPKIRNVDDFLNHGKTRLWSGYVKDGELRYVSSHSLHELMEILEKDVEIVSGKKLVIRKLHLPIYGLDQSSQAPVTTRQRLNQPKQAKPQKTSPIILNTKDDFPTIIYEPDQILVSDKAFRYSPDLSDPWYGLRIGVPAEDAQAIFGLHRKLKPGEKFTWNWTMNPA